MRIAGYAALFDIADAARDTIRPGAFAATLAQRRDPLPLLWQHDPIDRPASRAAALLAARAVSGLSFGFRARSAHSGPQGRELIALDLIEISLVTHPLQHGARVHLVA